MSDLLNNQSVNKYFLAQLMYSKIPGLKYLAYLCLFPLLNTYVFICYFNRIFPLRTECSLLKRCLLKCTIKTIYF